jgi:hypothetical protein
MAQIKVIAIKFIKIAHIYLRGSRESGRDIKANHISNMVHLKPAEFYCVETQK